MSDNRNDNRVKVLFIGGTGIISSACSALALEKGLDLYLLNRGRSSRPVPEGARVLNGDIRDPDVASRSVTVTEVTVSPDLRQATVFVVPLGGGDMTKLLAGLKRVAPFPAAAGCHGAEIA